MEPSSLLDSSVNLCYYSTFMFPFCKVYCKTVCKSQSIYCQFFSSNEHFDVLNISQVYRAHESKCYFEVMAALGRSSTLIGSIHSQGQMNIDIFLFLTSLFKIRKRFFASVIKIISCTLQAQHYLTPSENRMSRKNSGSGCIVGTRPLILRLVFSAFLVFFTLCEY